MFPLSGVLFFYNTWWGNEEKLQQDKESLKFAV